MMNSRKLTDHDITSKIIPIGKYLVKHESLAYVFLRAEFLLFYDVKTLFI